MFIPSIYKSTNRYTGTVVAGVTANVAITSVVQAASYIRITKSIVNGVNAIDRFARLSITSSTNVQVLAFGDTIVEFEVIEFIPGLVKSITEYTLAVTPATGTLSNYTISAVVMNKTFVQSLGAQVTTSTSSGQVDDETILDLTLTSTTNVRQTRSQSLNNSITFGIAVVEMK